MVTSMGRPTKSIPDERENVSSGFIGCSGVREIMVFKAKVAKKGI
jgi:hypothetical protein